MQMHNELLLIDLPSSPAIANTHVVRSWLRRTET